MGADIRSLFDRTDANERVLSEIAATGLGGPIPSAPLLEKDESMANEITRPELDAKLELIETRMDGRIERIQSLLERVREDASETRSLMREIRSDNKSTRWTVVITGLTFVLTVVGAAIASVIAINSANISLSQTLAAMFESGRNAGQAQPNKSEAK